MDALTGLPTYHDLATVFADLQAEEGTVRGLSAILFDVDGLIWVNDQQGYDEGNALLARLAKWLESRFTAGSCVRVGGDEFLVLLPKTTLEDAALSAREVLDEWERLRIPYARRDKPRDFLALNAVVLTAHPGMASEIGRLRDEWAMAIYGAKCLQKRDCSVVAVRGG